MLDRNKVISQISSLVEKIFPDLDNQNNLAQEVFLKISQDENFADNVERSKSLFLVPSWDGNLDDVFNIKTNKNPYSVLSVDGSQIYPDRHVGGAKCFLINMGGCLLEYTEARSTAHMFCEPTVLLPQDIISPDDEKVKFSIDMVDLKREELELANMYQKALYYKDKKPICFVDGSLVFWFLETRNPEVKAKFLNEYLYYLDKFYQEHIPVAGYISFPKSREIVNLIKIGLCRFDFAECGICHRKYKEFPCKSVDNLIDTQVLRLLLKPLQRTTIFWSNSKVTESYPEHLKPCFFYLNVGKEIVRIETLKWIAQDPEMLDAVCVASIDQAIKGNGYPVVIAESHEQAVVKGPDRDFFYHLIQKIGIENKKRFFISQKSLKKKRIGV